MQDNKKKVKKLISLYTLVLLNQNKGTKSLIHNPALLLHANGILYCGYQDD